MKNNSGITLVSLVVIIVLLVIFSSMAIYTGVDSYKIVDLQKYKVQMQAIQSAVDEFYEEYENQYTKNKSELNSSVLKDNYNNIIGPIDEKNFLNYFIEYKQTDETDTIMSFIKNSSITGNIKNYEIIQNDETGSFEKEKNWWINVAKNFGISIYEQEIQEQYYYLTKDDIETVFGVDNIDISEGFIINFQERYVFSLTPIEIQKTDEDVQVEVYCLYQLNEEEKVINFEVKNTNGKLDIDVIENTLYYQKIRIKLVGQESTIKQLYFNNQNFTDQNTQEEDLIVENRKDLFTEVIGIGTDTVELKIVKEGEYNFWARDLFEGLYINNSSVKVKLHEFPVLEDNMIPFIAGTKRTTTENGYEYTGIVYPKEGSDNINEWYNYAEGRYATAVITYDTYEDKKGKNFTLLQNIETDEIGENNHIVKVWIPEKLWDNNEIILSNVKNTDFINKTGVWVRAKWDDENNKWIPDTEYYPYRNTTIFEFDGTKIQVRRS